MRNFWPLVLLLLLNLVGSCCLAWQDLQGEQGPKTALEFDPIKRTLSSLTDFAGETMRYIWTRPIRDLKIIPPPGTLNEKVPGTAIIEYDPYGRLTSAKRDALQLLSVTFDEESRPKTVRTPDRTYIYSYSIEGELIELEGGDQPIRYSEYSVAGKPQTKYTATNVNPKSNCADSIRSRRNGYL